jgi:hypothetical protein
MTFWELAQSWNHIPQRKEPGGEWKCLPECHRCQFEALARDRAKEWLKTSDLMSKQEEFGEQFKHGFWQGVTSCVEDLGVPEQEDK